MEETKMIRKNRYCPGQECKMRDKCAIHKSPIITSIWPSLTDWSVFLDNSISPPEYCCGDNGNYKLLVPLEDGENYIEEQKTESMNIFPINSENDDLLTLEQQLSDRLLSIVTELYGRTNSDNVVFATTYDELCNKGIEILKSLKQIEEEINCEGV